MEVPDAPPPYRSVVFDCDSTLTAMEGIEALAGAHAAELVRMTEAAMDGRMRLEDAYGRRLDLVRPRREDVARIGREYVARMVPGADRLVAALHALEKRVFIVSGGLSPAVRHLGRHLGIPDENIAAVELAFDARGDYVDFDAASPLARSGGKPEVVACLAATPGVAPIALVGDGITDLEAAPRVARFVAFGGVERRAAVFAAARIHCVERDFRALVPLLLAADEIAALSAHPAHGGWMRTP
ncbi:MAG: HAD-IB family phosphatase [Planctomycetota bacterium]